MLLLVLLLLKKGYNDPLCHAPNVHHYNMKSGMGVQSAMQYQRIATGGRCTFSIPCPTSQSFTDAFINFFVCPMLIQFVSDSKEKYWLPRWSHWNSTCPIELLILGGFQYLGRGWTFDDLEESTTISTEVQQNYFHEFIAIGANVLYPMNVLTPLRYPYCH